MCYIDLHQIHFPFYVRIGWKQNDKEFCIESVQYFCIDVIMKCAFNSISCLSRYLGDILLQIVTLQCITQANRKSLHIHHHFLWLYEL
jgi:hypothetical protein